MFAAALLAGFVSVPTAPLPREKPITPRAAARRRAAAVSESGQGARRAADVLRLPQPGAADDRVRAERGRATMRPPT